MKKYIITLLVLLTPYLVYAQASKKNDMRGKIGISLYGGPNIPVGGNYSSTVKTTDMFSVGTQLGIGVSYYITKGFGFEGTLNGGYNYYRDKYRPVGKDPLWLNSSATISAIYNFGHLFRNPVVSPFVRVGFGSYSWENLKDGIIEAEVVKDNNNHSVNSFGFNIGAGAEYSISKRFTVGLMLDYNVSHPKEEETSNDRTVHSIFTPQIKISYYIPTR
jgi:opacity protein-like surface antigen